jgi:hypothetical protein
MNTNPVTFPKTDLCNITLLLSEMNDRTEKDGDIVLYRLFYSRLLLQIAPVLKLPGTASIFYGL